MEHRVYTGEKPENDYARIGLGFRLGLLQEESGRKGADEYLEFVEKIRKRPRDFDNTFMSLGNYTEPEILSPHASLSAAILSDTPDFNDDWRFFGKKIEYSNQKDCKILASLDDFVREAVSIFDHINQSGFY